MDQEPTAPKRDAKKTVRMTILIVVLMSIFAYALVPLYNTFCKLTGVNGKYNGETLAQEGNATEESHHIDKTRTITVQFIANNNETLPWTFRPNIKSVDLHPGENTHVSYYASNDTDHKMTIQAIPSISPGQAAQHLKKTECFCFTQQTLGGHQHRDMPIVFHLDEKLPKWINTVTLSYTFFDVTGKKVKPSNKPVGKIGIMSEVHAFKTDEYYVPHESGWPIFGALALFLVGFGGIHFLHGNHIGPELFWAGVALVVIMFFGWFRIVIKESLAGKNSAQMDRSYRWGMFWFIVSEVFFFGAFFGALFYVRMFTTPELAGVDHGIIGEILRNVLTHEFLWPDFHLHWPQLVNPNNTLFVGPERVINPWHIPLLNTVLLFSSAIVLTWAHWALKKGNRIQLNIGMFITIALGATFVGFQVYEYLLAHFHYGLTIYSGIYGSTFFMLTGFHALHVTMGLTMLIVIWMRCLKGHFTADNHFGFEAVAWYWHFVDVVWIGLFIFVYWL